MTKTPQLKINWLRLKVLKHLSIIKRLTLRRLYNILLLIFELKARRKKLKSRPFIAQINTTPFCNLKCPGCYLQTSKDDPNATRKIMSFNEYADIINQLSPYLLLVVLYDEGEPLLNKDIFRMIKYNHQLNINTSIATNLSMKLSDSQIEDLVLSGLDRLQVAIDGSTDDIYERYRVGGSLARVKHNLQRILIYKQKLRTKHPNITIQFIDFGYNSHQMQEVKEYSQEIGATFSTLPSSEFGLYHYVEKENISIPEREHLAIGCFDLYGIAHIRSDCVVFPCDFGEDEGMGSLGSLQEKDFHALWNNDFMQKLRKGFSRRSRTLPTKNCKDCQATNRVPALFR